MPLPNYPGGTIVYTSIAVDTKTLIINNITTQMVAAGWTNTAIAAYNTLTFTGVQTNNQTVVIGAKTYTWKTALTGAANEVFIGANSGACASNLFDAITDNTPNEGTTYGTGTTANADFTATLNGSVVTVTALVAGTGGNNISTFTNGSSNITFLYSGVSRYGGETLYSATTPSGLNCCLDLQDDNTYVTGYFGTGDRAIIATTAMNLEALGGRSLQIRATKYDVFIWLIGSYTTARAELFGGVPYLESSSTAKVVLAVANNTGLYEIETLTAHGLVTGTAVYISGATGQPGINGAWTATVISSVKYTLDGSTYASGYTASSAMAGASAGEITRCYWSTQGTGQEASSWRSNIGPNFYGAPTNVLLNQHYWGGSIAAALLFTTVFNADTTAVLRWGTRYHILPPRFGWAVTASGATRYEVGMVWGAMLITSDADMDKTISSWDGHNWVCLTDRIGNRTGSLWLATS
jgi:hypothetical protein